MSIRLGEESEDCIGIADRLALGTKGAAEAEREVPSFDGVPWGAEGFCGKLGCNSLTERLAEDAPRERGGFRAWGGGVIGSGEEYVCELGKGGRRPVVSRLFGRRRFSSTKT